MEKVRVFTNMACHVNLLFTFWVKLNSFNLRDLTGLNNTVVTALLKTVDPTVPFINVNSYVQELLVQRFCTCTRKTETWKHTKPFSGLRFKTESIPASCDFAGILGVTVAGGVAATFDGDLGAPLAASSSMLYW